MITKDTLIIEAIQAHPELIEVFTRFGMGCLECMGITNETIENGARMHMIIPEQLLAELNKAIKF